jgi:molecular chaperone GrpE
MIGQAEQPEPAAENTEMDATDDQAATGQDLTTALAAAEAKASENWDRYLRAAAEMENVRKRASRDVEHARKFALESFGRELLDVKDSLEIGLEAEAGTDAAALREGTEATLKLLTTKLEQFGFSTIDPAGEPFDPEHHEAISMQPAPDAEPGSILAVIQKGYLLNGRLLRPARVVVATEAPAE